MKKLVLTFCVLAVTLIANAQTLLIDPAQEGGFELGTTLASNGWNSVVGSTDTWVVGNVPVPPTGANCGYLSSDGGVSWSYGAFSTYSHLYRDITIPANEPKLTLTFGWSAEGEGTTNDWDNLKVFLAPIGSTVSTTGYPTGAIFLGGPNANTTTTPSYSFSTGWESETITFGAAPGQTYRLFFTWKSDGSTLGNPPAAIDNISLSSAPAGTFISVQSGNWNNPSTWQANAVPTGFDNATVSAGHTVTVNASNLSIGELLVDGTLEYGSTPSTFDINSNLTVSSNGIVNVFNATTGKTLLVGGNIVNNGLINVSVGATTGGILTLDGVVPQTVSGTGSFSTKIRNLNLANTSTVIPNINWLVNGVSVEYNLTITNQKINLGGNTLTYGTSGTLTGNTFSFTNGGFLNGTFSRWWTSTGTGYTTTIAITTTPTGAAGRYPFFDTNGSERVFYIGRTTPSGAGTYAVTYNNATTTTTGLSIVDGATTITNRWDGNFVVTQPTTGATAASYHVGVYAPNAMYVSAAPNILLQNAAMSGTQLSGFPNLGTRRSGVSEVDLLNASGIYIGTNSANIEAVTATSGAWDNPTTWVSGVVPTCADNVNIMAGHTVTVSSATNVALKITIKTGGQLDIISGDLTVGCTDNNTLFVNNGTLNVNGGVLTVNGKATMASGSSFTQSGGEIFIDPNSGTPATSISGNALELLSNTLNLTGGRITIVDPPEGTNNSVYYSNGSHVNITSGTHTLRFGDGVSNLNVTSATNGFRLNTWASTGRILFRNIEVHGLNATNRFVSLSYSGGVDSNLTIHANSTFRPASNAYYIGANLTNNGTFLSTTTVALSSFLSGTAGSTSKAQVVSGTGVFSNVVTGTATGNLVTLTVNNTSAAGVTLQVPLRISGTLNLTNGKIYNSSTILISLGTTTAPGTLNGGSNTAYIAGPFQQTFANSNTSTRVFPIGTTSNFAPLSLNPTTTSVAEFKAEAIIDNTGSIPTTVDSLNDVKWNLENVAGTYTSYMPSIAKAGIQSYSLILSSSTLGGLYTQSMGSSSYNGLSTPPSISTLAPVLLANHLPFISFAVPPSCSGVPAPGNAVLVSPAICSGLNALIGVQNPTLGLGVSYTWETSTDSINFTPIAGATDTILNVMPAGQFIRAKVECGVGPATGFSSIIKLKNTYSILSAPDQSKCGPGTVALTAVGNAGNIYWGASPTTVSNALMGSPINITVSNDTTLYVKAGVYFSGSIIVGAGDILAASSYTNGNIFYGLFGGFKAQSIILASELSALGFSAGDNIVSLGLDVAAVGSPGTYNSYNLSMGHTNLSAVTTSFTPHASLTNLYKGNLTLTANSINTLTFGTGTSNNSFVWDGVSNLLIENLWTENASTAPTSELRTNTTSFTSTVYDRFDDYTEADAINETSGNGTYSFRPKFILNKEKFCASDVEDVFVDFTAAPALTVNLSTDSICVGNSTQLISLTSPVANFDTYSWSMPATGSETTGWTLDPATTSTYVLNASNSTGMMCENSTSVVVFVDTNIPSAPTATQASFDICVGDNSRILTANSILNYQGSVSSGTLNLPINASSFVHNSSLTMGSIPANATITSVEVELNATHTYVGDLIVTLTSPNGSSVILMDEVGGTGDNLVNTVISSNGGLAFTAALAPFTGVYGSSFSMTPLLNNPVNGVWTLNVEDTYPSLDHGSFHNWSLRINYTTPTQITWYDAATAGNVLGTSNTLESVGTPVLPNTNNTGTFDFFAQANTALCTSPRTNIVVNVNALPIVNAGNDTTLCELSSLTLNGTGNASSYTWNNGVTDGVSFAAVAGNYVVTGINAFGCINKDSLTVSTLVLPTINAGIDFADCYGTPTTLTATGTATTVSWNNGVTDGVSFPLIIAGDYIVQGVGVNGCTNQDTVVATVHALPTVGAGVDVETCDNMPVTLSGSGANSYVWDNNVTDGVAFVQPIGTVTYVVIGTDLNSCVGTDTVKVTVNPYTTMSLGNDESICQDVALNLMATTANDTSGFWITNGLGTIAPDLLSSNIIYTPALGEIGNIYFVYTAEGFCNTISDSVIVTINPNPVIDLGQDIVTTNATSVLTATAGMTTYLWSTGETTQTITVNQNGSYSVVVTDANGCSNSDTISFITTFSVENLDGTKGSIDIFPNPTKDIVNLQFMDVKANEVKVDVLSMSGAVISTNMAYLTAGNGLVVLNLGNVAEGVYIVRMSYNNTSTSHRIVVSK